MDVFALRIGSETFAFSDDMHSFKLNVGQTKIVIGCFGIIAFVGAGIFFSKRRKQNFLLKKSLCIHKQNQIVLHSKLQRLDEDDPEERNDILELSIKDLIEAAKNGKFSPVAILRAYTYKACLITKNLNCVTSVIEDAELQAAQLDEKASANLKLFAVPVSIKECLEIKGTDATGGLLQHLDHPSTRDAVVVQVLRHCGAIPFVKTNISQMMFSFESSNPLFGQTLHPLNNNFTPGGSSSGEGALIGAAGCLLGIGSDTGGSIRCPAHLCGIAGFMPTRNRISSRGLRVLPGQVGPMARDVNSLVLAMQSLLCPLMFQLDFTVPPIPFNNQLYHSNGPLRIGYYYDDNYLKPVPAVKRAVEVARRALRHAGHILVPFNVPRTASVMKMFTQRVIGTSSTTCLGVLNDEPIDPILLELVDKWSMTSLKRWIKSTSLGFKSPRISDDLRAHAGNLSVEKIQALELEIEKYQQEFYDLWKQDELDALICPPFPVVAGPLGALKNLTGLMSYTVLYSLLKYPAGVVPVTKVHKHDQNGLRNYVGHYNDEWDQHIKETCKDSFGMPVGVQCVALPFHDEVCLRVMKEIEIAVNYDG